MSALLKEHNIQIEKQSDNGHEICHAFKVGLPRSTSYLIDSGASKDLFSSLSVKEGPTIHMGDDSQILAAGRGTIRAKNGVFRYVLYVPSLVANLLYVYQMTNTGSPKQVVFGPDSVEITKISTGELVAKGNVTIMPPRNIFSLTSCHLQFQHHHSFHSKQMKAKHSFTSYCRYSFIS